ncbi:MAG: ABC transporter substrate-binding protein [Alphaproteobacteria bacterium]|nr:ABC transporter substrate-binding protein [Alphaproteobacteria bacterium]
MIKPISRRQLLQTGFASSAFYMLARRLPNIVKPAWAQENANTDKKPFNIGLISHKTGAYAEYGLWAEFIAKQAVATINGDGGINGRMLNLIVADDKSSAKQASRNMSSLAQQKCDVIIGGLITNLSDVCINEAERLKTPYLSCSGTDLIAHGKANRYVFQPAIADIRTHITHSADWLTKNLGRKMTVIFPDKSDAIARNVNQLNDALAKRGAEILQYIKIPSAKDADDATKLSAYFHQIPIDTQVIYYFFKGANAALFLTSLHDYYNSNRHLTKPACFGMMEAWENFDVEDENMSFLDNSYFIEYHPRYANNTIGEYENAFRAQIGLDAKAQKIILETNDTTTDDAEQPPKNDIAPDTKIMPYGRLAAIWETVFFIRDALANADYQNQAQRNNLIEAMENTKDISYSLKYPQGRKIFNGRMHQVFTQHYISKRERGRVKLIDTTEIDNFYPYRSVNYTTQNLS